jgi:cytochrome c-type biogenesis protein CcmH/NrfG
MGFFKLHQPREFKHRFIYYDPKKEAQKEREKRLVEGNENNDAEFKTSIRRGSFREEAEKNKNSRRKQSRSSNIRVLVIIIALLALMYYLLS